MPLLLIYFAQLHTLICNINLIPVVIQEGKLKLKWICEVAQNKLVVIRFCAARLLPGLTV